MSGRQGWLVALAIAAAVLVVLLVMMWPDARPKEISVELDDDAGTVGAFSDPQLTAMRSRAAKLDAGEVPLITNAPGTLATFGWGNGEGKLGRNRPEEANPEAPMSLTTDAQGNVWVLDQVNGRMVKLDKAGKPSGEMPLTMQTPQDLAFAKDGTALVLDRLNDGAVALMGTDGKQIGELKIEGKGIEEGGAVTGVFADGNDVYVEREHGDLVRLGDTRGTVDPDRPEIPGRPTRDGLSFLSAGISDAATGRVTVTSIDRKSQEHRFTRELPLSMMVMSIVLLDSDRSGVIYLGAMGERPLPNGDTGPAFISLVCLDPLDGRPLGRAEVPANLDADETFRELTVLDEGSVLYLYRTENGSEMRRVDCR